MQKTKTLSFIFCWVPVFIFFLGCNESAVENARPNILFILSDDHASRTISAYGDSINATPNLDRLANEGALFPNSFCTNSICAPSRAAILTGKHSHRNGVYTNGSPWDGSQMQLPRLFKENGYQTALIGKWHLNSDPGDEYDYFKILTGAGRQGFYYNPAFLTSDSGALEMQGYSTDLVRQEAIRWLQDKRDPEKPFLLFTQFKAVHVPRMPEFRFFDLYQEDSIPEPPTLFDDYENRAPYAAQANMFIWRSNQLPPYGTYDLTKPKFIYLARMAEAQRKRYHEFYDPQNEEYQRLKEAGRLEGEQETRYWYQRFMKDYLRVVAGLDDNIGRILDYLDESGLADNTVVVYCSDQGYFTGEHGWAEKRFMYEEALEMPLLMRWPEVISPGARIEALVQNIDYAPTFLDMAGIPVPVEMQGRSFTPLLKGERPVDWRNSIYYHYYEHGGHGVPRHEGVRTDRYKLIHYYTDDVWEFFDLQEDPREMRNAYDDPRHKNQVGRLRHKLRELKNQYLVVDSIFVEPYMR